MNKFTNKAWQQYEAGKEYKRRIGLYETAVRNEAFYRGEQWKSGEGADLPKPVFNIIRRVLDYLICSVASADISIKFSDENLPFVEKECDRDAIIAATDALSENAAYRWERTGMDKKLLEALTNAALTGDGVLYCYWEPSMPSPQLYDGDIVTEVCDNVNLFLADVNKADIQSQDYVILSGRDTVAKLRAEARSFGVSEKDIERIKSDEEQSYQSGAMAKYELNGIEDEKKATYIIKFWKENGRVCFEKSTRECVIRRVRTDCLLYPVAYFNWTPTKNSCHGTSPVTALIPNQKYVNRAYAMAMKHMTDTAFSKVIYDKSKIPEWSNEVGQAIAAVGGGNIADAVSVIETGEMQHGYVDLIESAVTLTKDVMGATESALGNMEATNTSAILALQETSKIPLRQIRTAFYRCIEELALIWADMICAYYPNERLLPCKVLDGVVAKQTNLKVLKRNMLCAGVDIAEVSRYSAANAQNMLDKLLDGSFITAEEYVKRIPSGIIPERQKLVEAIASRMKKEEEEKILERSIGADSTIGM